MMASGHVQGELWAASSEHPGAAKVSGVWKELMVCGVGKELEVSGVGEKLTVIGVEKKCDRVGKEKTVSGVGNELTVMIETPLFCFVFSTRWALGALWTQRVRLWLMGKG
jgi:hypothetical protein